VTCSFATAIKHEGNGCTLVVDGGCRTDTSHDVVAQLGQASPRSSASCLLCRPQHNKEHTIVSITRKLRLQLPPRHTHAQR